MAGRQWSRRHGTGRPGLPDSLPESLPGIHVSSALARTMGNRTLLRTLWGLSRTPRRRGSRIRTALEGGDAVAARRLAHTIQGVAGNLSMTDVYACARTAEALIQGADLARIPVALESLDHAIQAVVPSVAHLLEAQPVPAQPAVVAEPSPLDAARLGALIVELDRSLRRNSLTAAASSAASWPRPLPAAAETCLHRLTDWRRVWPAWTSGRPRTLLAEVAARLDVTLQ